jgi:hypothetical protein
MSTPPEPSRRATKKRITEDEWSSYKTEINKLYIDQNKDVKEVRDILKKNWGFDAQ